MGSWSTVLDWALPVLLVAILAAGAAYDSWRDHRREDRW